MKRRIFSVLTALALCLTLLPVPALAAEGTGTADDPWKCGNNVTVTLVDGVLTFEGEGDMTNELTLSSDRPWRAERGSITSAVIGSGITSIGKSILEDLNKLTSVQIASTVTSIGDRAFYGCEVLSTVKLPSNLTSIGTYAFSYCRGLASIEIPSGVKTLGDNAFSSTGLTEVTIPDGVTSIGKNAFANCASLTTVEIPASVTTIGEGALGGKTNAEIHYPGTTDQWNTITGGNSGAQTDKVHTSDSDVTYQVTIVNDEAGAFGTGTYKAKETVKVFAGMKDKFAFAGWTVSPEGVTLEGFDPSKAETSFTMPAENVTLTASWAEAVVIASGVYFADLQAAFDYAANDEYSHGVLLLKDVTVDKPITLSKGEVLLTGGGHTLTGTGSATISVTGGSLTLEDVTVKNTSEGQVLAPGAVIPGTAINVSGSGNLTVSDGSAVRAEGKDGWALFYSGGQAHITIQGGTISGGEGFGFNTTGDFTADKISLLGGTFIGRTGSAVRVPSDFTLWDLVGVGLTLVNDDTKEIVDLLGQSTGPGTFTVSCGHFRVESETVTSSAPDENGVVTVTAACQRCKETVTLGTLTMVGSGQTITYGDQEPTLEVQAKGLIVIGYEWSGSGVPSGNTNSTITPAAFGTGEFNYTCAVTFTVPGGTGSANLKFTLKVEPLDISTVEWTVRIDPGKAAYNGQPQRLSSIVVSNNSMSLREDQFDIQFVDASGSEAAEQTDAGTYKIKLTGKDVLEGTVTLTSPTFTIEKATPTIEWAADAAETLSYTGKAAILATEPTVTLVTGETYNKEENGELVHSYATAEAGPYKQGLPTNPGTYYIKAALPEQTNYAAAESANSLKLVITKAVAQITKAPAAENPAYNGKPQALVTAAETSVGEVQYALSKTGPWSKEIPTATVPGTYEVYYKVPETANYTGVAVQGPVNVEIKKAEVVAASQNLLVKNKLAKTYTLDLKPFLPDLPQGQEYGKLIYELTETDIQTEGYIVAGTVKLNGTVLTVPVKAVEDSKVEAVAVIIVTIKSDNFKDIQQIVTVSSTNKTPVTITGVTAAGWTYDGKVHPGCTGTPDTGEYTGELEALYGTWPFTDWLDGAPKDAGTYQVHLSIPEDGTEYEGEIILFFTVEQAQVTIKADDKTAYVGEEMPELTWRVVSGLASGESLKTNPTPVCDADMSKAGTYPITISGGAVPDGGNYKAEIVYQNGTLTVSEKPAPPKPVDPTPPVDPDDLEVKLEVKEGFTEVPPALRALEHLNTPEKLTQVMRTAVTRTGVPSGNTAVYDVSLMVSTDGGRTWVPATSANFPSGGLTVTLPYPAGTDSGYTFTVVHMFTSAAFDKIPGDTESPAVTNTEQGLRFTVTGLSPISVGWRAKTTGTGGSSSGGSHSGGGGAWPMASVTVERAEHGKVTSDRSSAGSGSPVTLTVQPDRGYRLESLTVTDSRGNKLHLTDKGGGKYAFTMPGGNVTVKAVFAPLADSGACDGGAACPSRAFTDLKSGAWYHEAVDFVLRNGLMNGYGNGGSGSLFGPEDRLSRAQFAQILYNKEGRPVGAGSASFTDVAPDAWCAPAVAWAAERGIAGGYGGGLFGPDDPITREQLAVMLWRYAGSPAAPGGELSFMDAERIGAHAREAICWAAQTGVMNGKAGGVLDPKGLATRAQTAQMLKNFLENG